MLPDAAAMTTPLAPSTGRALLNKVPEVTIWFWVIKVLATTVGETAADYLNDTLGFGLTGTTVAIGAVFLVVLGFQFRARRYVPPLYWATVVLISVVGTLITDNLTDNLGVPLEVTTAVFAVALALTFAGWYAVERTLSIHSVVTRRREAFYWLAILFTFALGTAAGDLVAERLGAGYWLSALLFAALIGAVAASHLVLQANAVLTSGSPTSSPARWAPRWATGSPRTGRRRTRPRDDADQRAVPGHDRRRRGLPGGQRARPAAPVEADTAR